MCCSRKGGGGGGGVVVWMEELNSLLAFLQAGFMQNG